MRFKTFIKTAVLILLGIFILVFFLFAKLPLILESQIQKNFPDFLKTADLDFSIQKIGISNAFISKIRLGQEFSIDSIRLDYSLGLFKGLVMDKVAISGVNLNAALDQNHHIHIQGVPFPDASTPENRFDGPAFLRFLPQKILVENSKILITALGDEFLIPFELMSTLGQGDKKMRIQAKIHPFGETIISHLTYDFIKGIEYVRVEASSVHMDHFAPYIRKNMNEVLFNGAIDFTLESFAPGNEWDLQVSRIDLIKPVDMALKEIKARISREGHLIHAAGTFGIAHPLLSENEMKYDVKMDTTKGMNSEFFIHTGPVSFIDEGMGGSFPDIEISGSFFMDENKIPNTWVRIASSQGKIQSTRHKILASGLSFDVPIRFPVSTENPGGNFSVLSITYNDQYHFGTNGRILQIHAGRFRIDGRILSKTLPDISVQLKTEFDLEKELKAVVNYETKPIKLNFADIQKIAPGKQKPFELDLSGSAQGSLEYDHGRLNTRMQVKISDTRLRFPELDLTLNGINARVDFNDLLVPETVPGQTMTIQSVDVKKIRISEAKIQFILEDAKSLLIENIRFKWCNGIVSTESIRFPQENNEHHLTLFCDRLELTELLKQMGAFHAEGDGTLSGRIPLVYKDGLISFNNGFLFSTPGSRGKVVIENTDKIIAGIPMDSPEFSQLDVAREALKNFDYEWAKLTLNTQGDTLVVNMELDGKPAGLLPFEYKKEFGGFIRVDASSPGSHFQGIKLDVNLKLPFNDVMKFGNQLKSILK